jgi:methionyl-tRNA formyltransferase
MPSPLRIVFFGTAELACASLEALAADGKYRVTGVVTQPDRPKGRDLKPQPSPVKATALKLGLPVLQPWKARDPAFLEALRALQPDLIVVAAYGQILPPALLALPSLGCLNVHTSLLPKYRGAAPIQWAIIDGEAETGVTIMLMDAGLDTGPMLRQEATAIRPEDDARTLHDSLATMGAGLLLRVIPDFVAGKIVPQPQPVEGASYARKITKEDGRIDWQLPAARLFNRLRGLTPWPGAFTWLPGEPAPVLVKVWQLQIITGRQGEPGEILEAGREGIVVACGQDALRLISLQREGGRRLTAAEFLPGCPLRAGDRFLSGPART